MSKTNKFKEVIKSEIRNILKEIKVNNPIEKYKEFHSQEELDEMARIAKTIKIADLEKAKAVIDKVKDTKKKWIADMIEKVIEAGDEGITQVALAKVLGKVDEFGDGRQQAINPEVRSLLQGDVFTFGTAGTKTEPTTKPQVELTPKNDDDEIITQVPDEEEPEIEITPEDEDDDDENEEEKDEWEKPETEESPEDEEELAKKAKTVGSVDKLNKELDSLITQRLDTAKQYKKAKDAGDKELETNLVSQLKDLTNKIKDKESEIKIKLGDEEEEI